MYKDILIQENLLQASYKIRRKGERERGGGHSKVLINKGARDVLIAGGFLESGSSQRNGEGIE